ncbi:hypothetical protein [Gilliamella mensalis]|uniref:hypothetical protein n=1 Tax=Gilliamella mensalis TaxID=1908520 RepID=UPI00117B0F13|nr:hypothetical protein [Gilliamella mensalis]
MNCLINHCNTVKPHKAIFGKMPYVVLADCFNYEEETSWCFPIPNFTQPFADLLGRRMSALL